LRDHSTGREEWTTIQLSLAVFSSLRNMPVLKTSRKRLRMSRVCETKQIAGHCRTACLGRNKRRALGRMGTDETGMAESRRITLR
jgi:hypothetical protein